MATPKPRPTDDEALCLISLRRERARAVLNEILHGCTATGVRMPTATQVLDYLTNIIMSLEMMLKLLSENWSSHDVGEMYEKVEGKPHPDPDLMADLKAATMNQKYLLSPSSGLIGRVPELEELGDGLMNRLISKYKKYIVEKDEPLPDSFARFLLDNAHRLYTTRGESISPAEYAAETVEGRDGWQVGMAVHEKRVGTIRKALENHLTNGRSLGVAEFKGYMLHL